MWEDKSYMNEEKGTGHQTRDGKSITDFLEYGTGRAGGRGRNKRPGIIVNDNTDREIKGSDEGLGKEQSSIVFTRITHLGCNREIRGCAGVGEYKCRYTINGDVERRSRAGNNLIVGDPMHVLWSGCWLVSDSNSDGSNQDWGEIIRRETSS